MDHRDQPDLSGTAPQRPRARRDPFFHPGRLNDPVVVGVTPKEDPTLLLLAERADIERGELNGDAHWYDLPSGEYSPLIPHQVWYKWIIFYPVDPTAAAAQTGEPADFSADDQARRTAANR